jgi:ABC-type uncharacterized transport system ATPase subunit
LLPISFFSQRLLQPAERIRQISIIFKLFTLAAANPVKKTTVENAAPATTELPASPTTVNSLVLPGSSAAPPQSPAGSGKKVDSLNFIAPLEIHAGIFKVKLAESFEIQSGQICVVSAGVGQGKTILLESILGIRLIKTGRIDLKTKYTQPWDLIRYMNQSDFYDSKEEQSFYTLRLNDIQDILAETKGQLLVIDDPLMGMDARARNHVVEKLSAANAAGATMVIASNDRQLVDLADHWLTINDAGEMQLRKKDVPA